MRNIWIVLLAFSPLALHAQDKWDLRRCVDYAMKNNISVKQADVQARFAALQLKQAQLNKIPTASFSTGVGGQFGRSIDPTSNQFTTSQFLYQNYQLQGGAPIYQFGRLKNAQIAADLNFQATQVDVQKTANDVALNVASYYLQVLASNEQIKIAEVQIAQTREQYDNTKKRVDAGALPELNLVELESQLATDSSNLITAKTTLQQNILFLKALLNLDMAADFDVAVPPVESIPVEPIAELQPEYVYGLAKATQPEIKAADLRIKSSEKSILSNKASLRPSLNGFYSLGSTYNNQAQDISGTSVINNYPIGQVNINGTSYQVTSIQPYTNYTFKKTQYFKQLNNNFQQAVGLSINVPIFSNGNARLSVENSKLNLL
ncbi:MAG TPA: TolC family protein, partial [Chitinophagaceae bacterium]|nr:TolC family protein [Chitinophagaceae bacterium]